MSSNYIPRDGDIILTTDRFIFYVFGYDHPADRIIAYVKYIPKQLQSQFQLEWIPFEWNLAETTYVRPRQLYSPKIFTEIRKSFKEHYPSYLYQDPYVGKPLFVVPVSMISKVFVPEVQLRELLAKSSPNALEQEAIELIQLLSTKTGIALSDFGLHGSLSTGMSTDQSDIDIAIYGAGNYLKVKNIVFELYKENKMKYLNEIETDELRMNKASYKGRKFVFNGIRKIQELHNTYGKYKYSPMRSIHFYCDVVKSMERMFRPAVYNIEEYFPADTKSLLVKKLWPSQVVSMIGEFRDIAKKGEEIEVQGLLEKVESVDSTEIYYRVVVGSGKGEEFIWPV